MNNILILSAGRRVELIQAFQLEIRKISPTAKVFATDMRPELSAGCHMADYAFRSPRITADGYIEFLLEKCIEHQIRLVIPTIDTELFLLAQHQEKFNLAGITVVISDINLVTDCRDKRRTSDLFRKLGITTPAIYSRENIQFPCFAKPYDGSSSIGTMVIHENSMLSEALLANEKIIYMELIDKSWTEFTVDAYFDKHGTLKCLVPRERIEVRSGEVSKGITRRNQVYDYLHARLLRLQGAKGCISVQIFANADRNSFAAIEINPRFGGGYPLSYSAGANYPGWLIAEYILNQDISFFDAWKADLLMLRYDAKVLIEDAKPLI